MKAVYVIEIAGKEIAVEHSSLTHAQAKAVSVAQQGQRVRVLPRQLGAAPHATTGANVVYEWDWGKREWTSRPATRGD